VRAFTLDDFDSPPRLRDDLPEPRPADHELLVRVHGSSVNPADAAAAGGFLRGMIEHEFPVTLGRDYAGVVEQAGSGVASYEPGDEVYGFVPLAAPAVHFGAWSELIAVPEDSVSAKPPGVDSASAGASPLAAITALEAHDALAPSGGEAVLVIGATGGVGSFFVQLATHAGAHVVAPAFAEDEAYLTDLGVGEILDRDAELDAIVRERYPGGVDAILDLVSRAPRDDAPLKEGGRLASPLGAAGEGPGRFNLFARPTAAKLQRLAGLLDDGSLRVRIQASYDLPHAADALRTLSASHVRGKIGVRVA
jgi:NADPH2:quinone reductase